VAKNGYIVALIVTALALGILWAMVYQVMTYEGASNRTIAIGIIKVAMIGPRGIVPVAEVVAAAGESVTPPPVPRIIADILNIEEQLRAMQE